MRPADIMMTVFLLWLMTGCSQPEPPSDSNATDQATASEAITATVVSEGHGFYLKHGCAVCHGRDGHGDGPMAAALQPKPRDFREADLFKYSRTAEAISKTIMTGMAGSTSMPSFVHIPEEERIRIAAYIVSLQELKEE